MSDLGGVGAWAAPGALVLGLLVGSFLNVVIHRLPRMLDREWRAQCAELAGAAPPEGERYNLAVPRSRCPICGHQITAAENIPVLSWLLLRGRCSACGTRISARYPLVELLTGLATAYVVWRWGLEWKALAAALLLWSLIALAFIDLDTQLLPDDITVPLVWAGLIASYFGLFTDLASSLWGAVGGYVVLWAVYWLFKLVRGKEGMGYGDFKLLAALGAWLGWQMLPLIILLSSVVGAAVGIGLVALRGRDHNVPFAFGPYLAAAGAVALLWGPDIVAAYFGD